jgi:adenylate cyclase
LIAHYFKRNWPRMLVSLLILTAFVMHASKRVEWDFISRLENIAYDARLLFTMPRTSDPRIVIVDIDEASLEAEGRWPWNRNKLARMLDQLFDQYGSFLVAFDVVFAEPEETTGLSVIRTLQEEGLVSSDVAGQRIEELKASLDHDQAFGRAIRGRRVIMGYFFTDADKDGRAPRVGTLPPPTFQAGQFAGRNIKFATAEGYGANLELLQKDALGAGHFISEPDQDGVVRQVPLLYEFDGNYYGALALAVAKVALGAEQVTPGFPKDSRAGRGYSDMEWLQLGDLRIPVNEGVRALVPFRGPQGSFPYVSATDVIRGTADPAALRDKIVLVGTTAKGLLDLRATPVAPDFPGVEVHANLISGILGPPETTGSRTQLKESPAYTVGADFVLVLVSGLIMALLLPALSPLAATGTTVILLFGMVGTNLAIWHWGNLVFPLATGVLAVLTLFLFNMSYGYLVEERGKRQLAGRFGQYIPPELVEELSENPEAMALKSENKELTVLFSDVRSFTTISEGLDPEELTALMNEYLTPMTGIIFKHRGTIDKYMGDAIMAFWGAPLDDPDHARHAMSAAMAMLEELREIQVRFQQKGWPAIRIGVGLSTGNMSVGNMGSEFRQAYTVMGDAVNLGSRLEGLTKEYGVELIVSDVTARAVPEYAYRELDRVRVKGKDQPVTIYQPLGLAKQQPRELLGELKLYREALKLYRTENWDMAELQFLNLHSAHPDERLYQLYCERIEHFRADPPDSGWDGVFTHKTK